MVQNNKGRGVHQRRVLTLLQNERRPMSNTEMAKILQCPLRQVGAAARVLAEQGTLYVDNTGGRPIYRTAVTSKLPSNAHIIHLTDRNMQPNEPLRPIHHGIRGSSLDLLF